MAIEIAGVTEAVKEATPSIDRIEKRRRHIGLVPLTAEGRLAIEWAITHETPAAARLDVLLELAEQLGSRVLPSADLDAWGRALTEIDTVAYCARLIEAQIIAGNTGSGIMLPDRDLDIDDH